MSSFGTSPTAPSLLIPSNPAFSYSDNAPRGGILINVHRASEPAVPSASFDSSSGGRSSDPASPITPSFAHESASPLLSPALGTDGKPLKIRFAPLPDPRRPRSLSTGRNIAWTNQIGDDGEEKRGYEFKDHASNQDADGNEYAVEDEDEGEDGDEDGDGDGEGGASGHGTGRSWSKTMGSSWKGTKKLLTGKNPVSSSHKEKEKEELGTYGAGAPLKKSVSTGGFIGSSPFRWTSETERRRSMQGPAPPTVTSLLSAHRPSASTASVPASPGHRRNSSLEPGGGPQHRGSSPNLTPIRMINGRVYGSRRASEAAEREKQIREKMEPAFVEWGQGQVAATSTSESSGGRSSFLGDNDDGGGMAWVKKRREERQKKEQEERERQARESAGSAGNQPADDGDTVSPGNLPTESRAEDEGLSSSHSSTSSLDIGEHISRRHASTNPKTPAIAASDLPPAPIIQVSDCEPVLPARGPDETSPDALGRVDDNVGPKGERMTPTPPSDGLTPRSENENGHVVQAMRIPSDSAKKAQAQGQKGKPVDVFGEVTRSKGAESDEEEEDEGEEEEEEDDGDFEEDEDEELAERTTSSAAGVEVISRHK